MTGYDYNFWSLIIQCGISIVALCSFIFLIIQNLILRKQVKAATAAIEMQKDLHSPDFIISNSGLAHHSSDQLQYFIEIVNNKPVATAISDIFLFFRFCRSEKPELSKYALDMRTMSHKQTFKSLLVQFFGRFYPNASQGKFELIRAGIRAWWKFRDKIEKREGGHSLAVDGDIIFHRISGPIGLMPHEVVKIEGDMTERALIHGMDFIEAIVVSPHPTKTNLDNVKKRVLFDIKQ